MSTLLDMNVRRESCSSILGVLLLLLVRGSCGELKEDVVNKAVGDSLELIAVYPKDDLEVQWKYNDITFAEYGRNDFKNVISEKFQGRLKMKKDNISVTVINLKLQDSGRFSVVAEGKLNAQSVQYETKFIVLHVHDLIRELKIEYNVSWLRSQNTCSVDLRCVASGDPRSVYSWSRRQIRTQGSQLSFSLGRAESSTVTCTANNTISSTNTTETLVCTGSEGPHTPSGFPQKYVLVAVGVGVVAVVILSGTLAACCRWRRNKGASESEAGITVYEDVNTASPAKKRTESVINGMTIYETVDDTKLSQNMPHTLYDKINYQRHPAVSTSTSSPYQEVL